MKLLKYIPLKLIPQFRKCTTTEPLEPFHAWDWWPGLESYLFCPKTMSFCAVLSYRTLHQQCCGVQRPAHWLAIDAPAWSEEPPSLRQFRTCHKPASWGVRGQE